MTFHVVKTNQPMMIGLQTSKKLGLVTFNLIVQTDDPNRAESRKDWKRPYSKNASELTLKPNLKT